MPPSLRTPPIIPGNRNLPVQQSTPNENENTKLTFKELVSLKTRRSKNIINWTSNGASALCSTVAFLCGNFFKPSSAIQEKLDFVSEISQRVGIFLSGLPGTAAGFQMKNFFGALGYFSYLPVALFTKGYELWLARGVSSSLINSVLITNQREKNVDDKGNPIPDSKGNIKHLSGNFKKKGWWEGFKITVRESTKMIRELFKNPSNIKKFTHSTLITSIVQLLSPVIGFVGAPKKLEAFIRNAAGIGSQVALALDGSNKKNSTQAKDNNAKKSILEILKTIDFKSPTVWSSLCRIATSVIDFIKRFDFISSRVTNLTDVSLMLDRIASMFYSQGIFNVDSDDEEEASNPQAATPNGKNGKAG